MKFYWHLSCLGEKVKSHFVKFTLSLFNWFSEINRNKYAFSYYENEVSKNTIFTDMLLPNKAMVIIDATDLTHSVRFLFMPEYFD